MRDTPDAPRTFRLTRADRTTAALVGLSVILISHKLDEVIEIADRISVLRGGRHVATVDNKGLTKQQLASLMVGRDLLFRIEKAPAQVGETRLTMEKVSARTDKGIPALRGLS